MRGRHISELAQSLRHAMSDCVARGDRRVGALTRQLARYDPRARLAETRGRLKTIDARLAGGARAGRARLTARFGTPGGPAQLRSARWRSWGAVTRSAGMARARASSGAPRMSRRGDAVQVTLGEGEIACRVERNE